MQQKMRADWYETLRKAAKYAISKQWTPGHWEENELINEAWVNSSHRLSPKVSLGLLFCTAVGSMLQYMGGKKKTRYHGIRALENRTVSISTKEGDLDFDHPSPESSISYDDIDEVEAFLHQIKKDRTRMIALYRLKGLCTKDIAKIYGVSESRISQILKKEISKWRKKQQIGYS